MKLVLNYLSNHLKVSLEYKISFILSTISQGLYMFANKYLIFSLSNDFYM